MVADYMSLDSMVDAYTQLFKQRLTPETVLAGLHLVGDIDGLHAAHKAAIVYFIANVPLMRVRRDIQLECTCSVCRKVGD
jgi:hypothetical protein